MAFVYWIHLPEHTDMFSEGYIGVTSKTVKQRYATHKKLAKSGEDTHLYRAMRKYGINNFVVDTVVDSDTDYCYMLENKLRPEANIGLNMAVGGSVCPMTGRVHSDETKAKIASKAALYKHSEEAKAKIGDTHRGKVVSEETRAKVSAARKGKPLSAEHRKAISLGGMGRVNSPESTAKTAAALRGRVRTKEHCEAISKARKGIPLTDEQKANISLRLRAAGPWNNPKAAKDVWAMASEVLLLSKTCGPKPLSELLGVTKASLLTMLKRFAEGWIPSEDTAYLSWLAEYNKQKECYGT